MNWQPIETAPKDGTRIILYVPIYNPPVWIGSFDISEYIHNGKMTYRKERWVVGLFNLGGDPEPTHWMPIPENPLAHHEKISSISGS